MYQKWLPVLGGLFVFLECSVFCKIRQNKAELHNRLGMYRIMYILEISLNYRVNNKGIRGSLRRNLLAPLPPERLNNACNVFGRYLSNNDHICLQAKFNNMSLQSNKHSYYLVKYLSHKGLKRHHARKTV